MAKSTLLKNEMICFQTLKMRPVQGGDILGECGDEQGVVVDYKYFSGRRLLHVKRCNIRSFSFTFKMDNFSFAFAIYTTQKKFRISCAYFFVLSTLNSCRLWRGWQIKIKFSEDVSCMTISNFCEKQFVLNDTTLIVQKPLFWPKNTKLH